MFKIIPFLIVDEKALTGVNKLVYSSDNILEAAVEFSNMIMINFNPSKKGGSFYR